MSPAPKSEIVLTKKLAQIGVGLRHRKDLRSWEIYRLRDQKTVAVCGGYGDIIHEGKRLTSPMKEAA